jgi:hypothetical protein
MATSEDTKMAVDSGYVLTGVDSCSDRLATSAWRYPRCRSLIEHCIPVQAAVAEIAASLSDQESG